MRLFQYRLEAALRRAEHEERARQIELARRQEMVDGGRRRVAALGLALERVQERLRQLQAGVVEVDRLRRLMGETERLGRMLDEAAQAQQLMEAAVVQARERLVEAARGRQTFETHREGRARDHRRAELREEMGHLDELATTRFGANPHAPQHRPRSAGEGRTGESGI